MAQHDDGALVGRQFCERGKHRVRVTGVCCGSRDAFDIEHLGAQLPHARPVDRSVDDDPVQPWAQWAAAVEAAEVANRRDERLLRDVLRGTVVLSDEEGGAIRPRPGGAEELARRLLRSACGIADKRAFAASTWSRHWRETRGFASRYCHPACQPNGLVLPGPMVSPIRARGRRATAPPPP